MNWNKNKLFDILLEALKTDLNQALKASKDAAEYAVDGESKAESQWDTQGIEASYLAAGQAQHARDLDQSIQQLQRAREALIQTTYFVGMGSVITIEAAKELNHYFISPVGGGKTIQFEDQTLTIISPQSPIAKQLSGKTVNAILRLPNNSLAHLKELQ